jgi:hypothetical protein
MAVNGGKTPHWHPVPAKVKPAKFVGRIWWSEATRIEDPLDISNGIWAPKSSGERDGTLSLVWFDVVCPLNGIMGTSTYSIMDNGVYTAWLEFWAYVGVSK